MVERAVLAGRVGDLPYVLIEQHSGNGGPRSYHVLVHHHQRVTPPEGFPDSMTEEQVANLITDAHVVDPVTRAAALEAALRHVIEELSTFELSTEHTEPRYHQWARAQRQALEQELRG